MRVLLVGTPDDCARLRVQLDTSAEIVDEFAFLPAARASRIEVDAYLVATGRERADGLVFQEPFTPRELQVLELLAEGLPNKVIASRLGISDQTVKFHVSSVAGKLGAVNRTDAVRRAVRRGLITL